MTLVDQTLTRRSFLGLCGLSIGAMAVGLPAVFPAEKTLLFGRGLVQSPILQNGKPLNTLWPDMRVRLVGETGSYFRLENGWVARESVQPMANYDPNPSAPAVFPVNAEVVGITAVIRQHPTVNSVILAHLGHGAAARLLDRLADGRGGLDWLQVELAPGLVGWSQIGPWQTVTTAETPLIDTIQLDLAQYQLNALSSSELVFAAPFAAGQVLTPGRYTIASAAHSAQVGSSYGLAYPLQFEVLQLVGDYQHHRFGGPNPGAAVQVAPAVARALSQLRRTDTRLIIV